MNQLEKLGLIMVKCIENAANEGGYMARDAFELYPNLTDEEWSEVLSVYEDVLSQ